MNAPQLIPVTSSPINGQMMQMVDTPAAISCWCGVISRPGFGNASLSSILLRMKISSSSPLPQFGSGKSWQTHRLLPHPRHGRGWRWSSAPCAVGRRGATSSTASGNCTVCNRSGSAAVKTCVTPLSRSQRQAINRQAWADVAGMTYAAFHARREALLREQVEHQTMTPCICRRPFAPPGHSEA